MQLRKKPFALLLIALFLLAGFAFPQDKEPNQGAGEAVVTVVPPRQVEVSPAIAKSQLSLKVNGKTTDISRWERLQGADAPVQLIVLIDDGVRGAFGNQLPDIAQFIHNLPPSAEAAVAYMNHGRANMAGPLTRDHAAITRELRVTTGAPGISGSPYFCLSDLAHHWPSSSASARRVTVMITDGVDNYEPSYNPQDPYVQAAIHDAVRSRISVYSIYWSGEGFARSGLNLLDQLTAATGGNSYWEGSGNPVSLEPYFKDLHRRLENQYRLGFTVPLPNGPGVASITLRASGTSARLVAPQQVFVGHPADGQPDAAQVD